MTLLLSRLNRGYTLIEVMVVILVIGFALSLVAIRLSPADSQREHKAQTLLYFLQQAKERAIFGGVAVTVHCAWQDRQQWLCEQKMKEAAQEQVMDNILLPRGWSLSASSNSDEGEFLQDEVINLWFLPDGETTYTGIIMHDQDSNGWRLQLSGTGGLSMELLHEKE